MKDYHINVFYSEDDEGYIADIPDLAQCSAFGTTPEEALRQVLQAKEAWLEAARAIVRSFIKPFECYPSNSPTRSARGLPGSHFQ